jgi:diguanylate cyclase (GGDEF)-like protein/hemerythrin-like metal-binding protein/PAS domain S-box-containing protein
MDFFYWNKSFEIGIPEVDAQHRRLVELINELATAITEGGALRDARAVFTDLTDYAATHFRDEELLMAASALSEAEKQGHIKAHRSFVRKAQEIAQSPRLVHAEVAEQVLQFLTTWLISHILGSDRRFAQAQKQARLGPTGDGLTFDIPPVESVLLGALTETERRFRLISDTLPVLMWVADANGMRSYFNRTWVNFVGLPEQAQQGVDWQGFIHPDDRPGYLQNLAALIRKPAPSEIEYRLRQADGTYHWFLEKILPRLDGANACHGFVAAATDISAIKQAEALMSDTNRALENEVARRTAQLEALIMTDPLTGVGNRRMLNKWLADEAARAHRFVRPLSLIFLDLDHFKVVNDGHGHAMGDLVLTEFARVIRAQLREGDLLGRFGGEEFVVLLPEAGGEAALQVAERIRSVMGRQRLAAMPMAITVSAGVAELGPAESGESMLRRSDMALYQAKEAGRNCCRLAAPAQAA